MIGYKLHVDWFVLDLEQRWEVVFVGDVRYESE